MPRRLSLSGDALTQMMAVVQQLGSGRDLDDILRVVAVAVTEVIGFDAVAVNVRRDNGLLEVRAVNGPPEVQDILGGRMSEADWRELLDSCEQWGGLYLCRTPELAAGVPTADPWNERLPSPSRPPAAPTEPGFLPPTPWRAEFALLAPVWASGQDGNSLSAVISVDLPRTGYTPDAEQQVLLELFAAQVGTAIDRVLEAEHASDRIGLYRAAFVESPIPTVMVDVDLRMGDVNDAFLELADAIPGELDQRHLVDLLDVSPGELAACLSGLEPGRTVTAVHDRRLIHPRGLVWERWVDVTARRVDSIHDNPRYVCTLTDRTTTRAEVEAIRHRADHDALTGLSTRTVWLDDIQARLAAHSNATSHVNYGGGCLGILFCDLDDFKTINDTSGHAAGDRVLIAVANKLQATTESGDTVCRWGGDEFAIVANRQSPGELTQLATAIRSAVADATTSTQPSEPIHGVSISIGLAVAQPARTSPTATSLIDIADSALYLAKNNTADGIHITVL